MEYRDLPDLKGMAALRAVIDKGGVNEAAAALHITQPAISKRLKGLEACYGVALTERVSGRLRLTSAGQRVYRLAVQILDRNLALHRELTAMAEGVGVLNLEVSHAIGEQFLAGWLRTFNQQWPSYKIISRVGYSRHIGIRVAAGQTDLAVLETAPDHPDVLVRKWQDDELWVVCGRRHPLAERDSIDLDELVQQEFVLRERQASARALFEQTLEQLDMPAIEATLEVGSNQALIELVADGRHLGVLPRFVATAANYRERIHQIQVRGLLIRRTLWIAQHRNQLDNEVAGTFVSLLTGL